MDTAPIFDKISGEYDRFNHLFSLNIDKRWRRGATRVAARIARKMALARGCQLSEIKVVDLACGTGDLSIMLAKKGLSVTGVDISEGMLEKGREKVENLWQGKNARYPRPVLEKGDGADLSFADSSVDIITIAYGIRNFDDRPESLREILRVLSPGGALLILEFGEPKNALFRLVYKPYFRHVMPGMASALTLGKDAAAYKYFISSVEKFPKFERFCKELSASGFQKAEYKSQTGGISVLYKAFKPMGK